jgi:hypothetical protein
MISKDLAIGLFFGGVVAMMTMAILDIWNAMGMAPLVLIIILDIVLAGDAFINEYYSRCETSNRRKKK